MFEDLEKKTTEKEIRFWAAFKHAVSDFIRNKRSKTTRNGLIKVSNRTNFYETELS